MTRAGHKDTRAAIGVFLLIFLGTAVFHQPVEYDNTLSRYMLMSAIVDVGALNIDRYQYATIDKSLFDGHYYSNKAIGGPLLAVPVYALIRSTAGPREPVLRTIDIYLVRVVTTSLPSALLGAVMYLAAVRWGATPRRAFLMTMAYAFGTIAWLHGILFSGHQMAACLVFACFLLVAWTRHARPPARCHVAASLLAGALAGLAVLTDYGCLLIVVCLTLDALLARGPIAARIAFLAGGGVFAALLMAYNLHCFGNAFSLSYSHQTFELFREGTERGLLGIDAPRLSTLGALLASPARGLFFVHPVLLLAIPGLYALWRSPYRREAAAILAVVAAAFLFNAGWYGWHGGWTFGPRYLTPMLPFLAFPVAFGRHDGFGFGLLLGLSIFQTGLSVIGVPHAAEEIANPIVEFILPCIGYGCTALTPAAWFGVRGLLPTVVALLLILLAASMLYRRLDVAADRHEGDRYAPATRAALAAWALLIVALLGWVHSPRQDRIHFLRWRVLKDTAERVQSPSLARAAERERTLMGGG